MEENGLPTIKDRRREVRVQHPVVIDYMIETRKESGERVISITRDLSQKGACILLKEKAGVDSIINVGLNLANSDPLLLSGRVKWQQRVCEGVANQTQFYLTGVQLIGLKSTDEDCLAQAVDEALEIRKSKDRLELIRAFKRSTTTASPTHDQIQTTNFRTRLARIVSSGWYLPSSVVKNGDIVLEKPEAFDIIVRRALGAVERRAALAKETNAEMMTSVAIQILSNANIQPSQLSRIICSSDPQDTVAPNVASVVQSNISAHCPAFDIQMSCAGWICDVDVALRCLSEEFGPSYILVLASSTVGSRLNFYNRRDRAIFGDGASGILLGTDGLESGKLMCTQLWTDGRFHNEIVAPLPWSNRPSVIPKNYEGSFYMSPNQDVFFSSLSQVLPPFFDRLLQEAGITVKDVDHFLLHQPSMPLFDHSVKILSNIPRSKVFDCFARYGNLVAAEMPMMLSQGVQAGRIKSGDVVLMLTYGAGFTMAGCVFEY